MTNIISPFDKIDIFENISPNDVLAFVEDEIGSRLPIHISHLKFLENKYEVGKYTIDLSWLFDNLDINKTYTLFLHGLREVISPTSIIDISDNRYEIKIDISNINNVNDAPSFYSFDYEFATEENLYKIINSYVDNISKQLVLKVIDPIKDEDRIGSTCAIYKRIFEEIAIPIIFDKSSLTDTNIDLEYLPGANVIASNDSIGAYNYENLVNNLTSSISQSIADDLFIWDNDTQLNIDYSDFSNHCFFASSKDVLDTAYNKIKKYINLEVVKQTVTQSNLSSLYSTYNDSQRKMYIDFTGYERYVYNTFWPRFNYTTGGLYHYTTSVVSGWYVTQSTSASLWDSKNDAQLYLKIPQYYFDEDLTGDFYNYVHVMAMHYDYIKQHIDQFVNFININYDGYNIPPNNMLWILAKFLGFNLKDGYLLDSLTKYLTGYGISGSNATTTLRNVSHNIAKRLLNNISYIYKTKGTLESIKALLNVYGIPAGLIQVDEHTIGGSRYETSSYEPYYVPTKSSRYLRMAQNPSAPSLNVTGLGFGSGTGGNGIDKTVEITFKTNHKNLSSEQKLIELKNGATAFVEAGVYITSGAISESNNAGIRIKWGDATTSGESEIVSCSLFDDKLTYIAFGVYRTGSTAVSTGAFLKIIKFDDELLAYNTGFDSKSMSKPNAAMGYVGSHNVTIQGITTTSMGTTWDVLEFRHWNRKLSENEMLKHAYDFRSVALDSPISNISQSTERWNYIDLDARYKINEAIDLNANTSGFINYAGNVTGQMIANNYPALPHFSASWYYWPRITKNTFTFVPSLSGRRKDRKIRVISGTEAPNVVDLPNIDILWSPISVIDDDIIDTLADVDFNDILGDSRDYYSGSYRLLNRYANNYFQKYVGSYDFYRFIDLVSKNDKGIKNSIEQLVPARAYLRYGLEIGSHMLERNKHHWSPISVNIQPHPSFSINKDDIYSLKSEKQKLNTFVFELESIKASGSLYNLRKQEGNPGIYELDINGFYSQAKAKQTYFNSVAFNTLSGIMNHIDYKYVYNEIEYATYLGTENSDLDGVVTASSWTSSIVFGEVITVN